MTSSTQITTVKCVIWDLDNTLWDGVLLEDDAVALRPGVGETIIELDRRGILHSVASRNDRELASAKLAELGLSDYFLVPQIGWGTKAASVKQIGERLNLGSDALAFVDDEEFDRGEVSHSLPDVRCYPASMATELSTLPEFTPARVTAEARHRRRLYQAQGRRDEDENQWEGPAEAFLQTLEMQLTLRPADLVDLERAEELTVRTHQLNTTGRSFSLDELAALSRSPDHDVIIAELEDRYGPYGKIGLALVDWTTGIPTLSLFLMSCRVMSRGIGTVFLNWLMRRAEERDQRLRAELRLNKRNRMMLITLRLSGFVEIERAGDSVLLEASRAAAPTPSYVTIRPARA